MINESGRRVMVLCTLNMMSTVLILQTTSRLLGRKKKKKKKKRKKKKKKTHLRRPITSVCPGSLAI